MPSRSLCLFMAQHQHLEAMHSGNGGDSIGRGVSLYPPVPGPPQTKALMTT